MNCAEPFYDFSWKWNGRKMQQSAVKIISIRHEWRRTHWTYFENWNWRNCTYI